MHFTPTFLPARGVTVAEVLPATILLGTLAVAILALCALYRGDRLPAVDRFAAWSERTSGLPAWAAIPSAVCTLSLLTAGFGFYWDVAVHIDNGRDVGPFGTPAHYPILIGLCGLALAGVLAITLDRDTDGGAALHLPFGLHCSLGAALVLLCGSVSLAGFPLDDIWHEMFGQDVTLWSPTHVQMVGGASLTTLSSWVLVEEGRRRGGTAGSRGLLARLVRPSTTGMAGAFLIGLSTLQAEFDYGVPQFNAIYQPVLIALAAAVGLVAARVRGGRYAALQAVAFFLALRSLFALVIVGSFGLSLPHIPLYLAEAVLVELVALVVPPARQVRFGALAGLLIGTAGTAAEWGWSQVAFVLPWRAALFPEALVLTALCGLAGGVLGAQVGRAVLPAPAVRVTSARWVAPVAFAALATVFGLLLPISVHSDYRATVDVTAAGQGTADLVVHVNPAGAADNAEWFNVTSWQGGRSISEGTGQQITLLRRTAPGVFVTAHPVPVTGEWKTLIRLAGAFDQQAVPVYLPEDKGIPVAGVPADKHFSRAFMADQTILQREQVGGSVTVKHLAYGVLSLLAALWIGTLSLGLLRLNASAARRRAPLVLAPRRHERAFA